MWEEYVRLKKRVRGGKRVTIEKLVCIRSINVVGLSLKKTKKKQKKEKEFC